LRLPELIGMLSVLAVVSFALIISSNIEPTSLEMLGWKPIVNCPTNYVYIDNNVNAEVDGYLAKTGCYKIDQECENKLSISESDIVNEIHAKSCYLAKSIVFESFNDHGMSIPNMWADKYTDFLISEDKTYSLKTKLVTSYQFSGKLVADQYGEKREYFITLYYSDGSSKTLASETIDGIYQKILDENGMDNSTKASMIYDHITSTGKRNGQENKN